MNAKSLHIILADDDPDDCIFFREVLEDLPVDTRLTTVHDGVELIFQLMSFKDQLPDVLFLDLNMPRKSGFECLVEIKSSEKLQRLPVIILSTSLDQEVATLLYEKGAHHYIRKPGEFSRLRTVIDSALRIVQVNRHQQPAKKNFILQS